MGLASVCLTAGYTCQCKTDMGKAGRTVLPLSDNAPTETHQLTAGLGFSVPFHQFMSVSAAAFLDQSERSTCTTATAIPRARIRSANSS